MHENIKDNFRKSRKRVHLSIGQMSDFLQVSQSSIRNFENGNSELDKSRIALSFRLFGIHLRDMKTFNCKPSIKTGDYSGLNTEELHEQLFINHHMLQIELMNEQEN